MKRFKRSLSLMLLVTILLSSATIKAQYSANSDLITTLVNTPVAFDLRANDTYPFNYQTLQFYFPGTTIGTPQHGTFQYIGDYIVYTPNQDFVGYESFNYAISLDGTTYIDSAMITIQILADTDPNFHLNMAGIPPATCYGGQLKVFMKNGVAPYLYQINGSAVATTLADSIIVDNFVSHTGTIQVTDANNLTVNTTFTVPNNRRLLCINGPSSGYTLPNQCIGNVAFGLWGGTPPFVATGSSMQGPEQVPFMWEGDDSHSRSAYASNVCQGFYNLFVIDSNGVQATGTFMIDTNSTNIPPIVTGIDTCIAITGYTDAFVSDVYTNSNGTYAVWNIVLLSTDTISLDVLYPIQNPGTYQFILYVNCPGGKSTVMLTDYYSVTYSDLVMSISENLGFEEVEVYPNPLKEKAMIRFNSKHSGSVEVNILNVIGKSVAHYSISTTLGSNLVAIDVENLSKGTYIIQLVDDRLNRMNVKVVK
jgi:hypothetical protein